MRKIKILDCTLRDGGYVNNWGFGEESILKIINKLNKANIDMIECGFIKNKSYEIGSTVFDSVERVNEIFSNSIKDFKLLAMINYGQYDINDIPKYNDNFLIKGIRVAFHKEEVKEALGYCRQIKEKGYKVFVQPMSTISYNDIEILSMIKEVNDINPYAIYIVDSFGVMKKNDLLRLFYLIDNNLNKNISLGYHSHNNIQLAFSNAQQLCDIHTERNLIIDSSVFGMGRGAGNLNTELFVEHYNNNFEKKYEIYPLLEIIDQELNKIYAENYWGYSLPHYLSANNNCHPNFATYLANKNTLTINSINQILSRIPENKKSNFDKQYVEKLYQEYQKNDIDDEKTKERLIDEFKDKNIVILAPGKSLKEYNKDIRKYINDNSIIININFKSEEYPVDYIFFSNERRYLDYIENSNKDNEKIIISSNLKKEVDVKNEYIINYNSLLNDNEIIYDNATLMFINFLIRCDYKNVYIAGFDGYVLNEKDSYIDPNMAHGTQAKDLIIRNEEISKKIKELDKKIRIKFITPTNYQKNLGDKDEK